MASAKLSKKELKGDEFLSTFDRVIRFVTLHSRSFRVAGIALILLIAAVSAARIYLERYEAKAARALYAANRAYQENLSLISEESPLEKRGTADFDKPLKLYQEVVRLYPRSHGAGEARYQTAQCYYRLSKYDDAISAFEAYLGRHPKSEFSVLAGLGLGSCLEQKSAFDKAATAYFKVISDNPKDPLIGEVYVSLGRCLEAAGKQSEASQTYDQVVEKFPNTSWKAYAERKLLYLKSR